MENTLLVLHEQYHRVKEPLKSRMRILNKHLLPIDTPVEGNYQIPLVLPYTGTIPETFVPYNAAIKEPAHDIGVYCHIDDRCFGSTWSRPVTALGKVMKYAVACAPDYTLWADGLICENVEQIRRTRTIQRFWQNNGVKVIQTASWADADSVTRYAFDGLAENSWTSVGHQRIGNKMEQKLYKYAIEALVERKRPVGLIVFGFPLDFDPGIPVVVKPSFIQKLRNL